MLRSNLAFRDEGTISPMTSSKATAPFKPLDQKAPVIETERRDDGSILIWSKLPMGPWPRSVPHMLDEQAARVPERNFLAKRTPAGGPWRFMTYGQAKEATDAVAQSMINRGMTKDTPCMILSGNSIEHAVIALGAMKAGVPAVPVSVPYSLLSKDHAKLKHVFEIAQPKMIFADDGDAFAPALLDLNLDGVEIVTCTGAPAGIATTAYEDILNTPVSAGVAQAMDRINHDTVGKFLFTSGSTGMPKGVYQTHGMMCAVVASQTALRVAPLDPDETPERLEWQPWNHISAGNIGFNFTLYQGGTYYIDDGRPIAGQFEETVRNLAEIPPTSFASAPVTFGILTDILERDPEFRHVFFSRIEFLSYGGATLSNDLYNRIQAFAIEETGFRLPFTTMYGATETQGITMVHWLTERVGLIGLPMPGITLKLVPNGRKLEVRVKGPTVTPGYIKNPDLTRAAFDEEGFYKLGDAAKFLDPDKPEEGLVFDGRVTEDFKLTTGTWVSAGTLRAEAIAAASPLIQDAIVCGQDRDYVALLAWPNLAAAKEICDNPEADTPDEILRNQAVVNFAIEHFRAHNASAGGSSKKIKRLMFMTEPPSIDGHEITDKGYVNQSATLDRRANLVEAVYAPITADDVIIIDA